MNALVVRWLASELVAFSLFPILFVLAGDAGARRGWVDGVTVMAFYQFSSPYELWRIPFIAGTAIALLWHVWTEWSAEGQPGH